MAVERAKVKAVLDAKFKGKSVSKELKDDYAGRWAAKIDTDDDIQTYVDDREDDVLAAAKEADRASSKATAKAKKEAADAVAGTKTDENAEDQDDSTDGAPDWFKKWESKQSAKDKARDEKLAGFEATRTADSISERFKKDDRLKGIPDFAFKGRIPKTEEDFEAAVTELAADYKQFADGNKITPLGTESAPGGGGAGGGGNTGKVDPAISAYAKQRAEQRAAQGDATS